MKHTKGTWVAKEGQIYPEETGKTLALIPYFDETMIEDNANADLIAAAPELLEALKALFSSSLCDREILGKEKKKLPEYERLIHNARQAVAKAEGNL